MTTYGENVLTMQEVQKKELTARLVVLSCCATGRGNVSAECVIGIARAFLECWCSFCSRFAVDN